MKERYCEGERFADLSFVEETFEDCDFTDCVFVDCSFAKCDLRKADFRDAIGYKVDILGSRLKDARFSLPEAVNLLADLKIKLS